MRCQCPRITKNYRWRRVLLLTVGASLLVAPAPATASATGGRQRSRRIRSIHRRSLLQSPSDEQQEPHDRRRGLKATGGPLDVLHQVWNDAANQKASDVQSDCLKVKGVGKGKGKGLSPKALSGAPSVSYSPTGSPAPTSKSLKAAISKSSKYCLDKPAGALPGAPTLAPTPANQFVPPTGATVPTPTQVPPPLSPTNPTDGVPPAASPLSIPPPESQAPAPPDLPAAPTPSQQQRPPPAPASTPPPVASLPTPGGVASPTSAVEPPNASSPVAPAAPASAQPPPTPTAASPSQPTAPQPPAPTQGGGSGNNSNRGRCQQVADETLVTNATESQTYRLEMELKLNASADVQTAMQQMQSALQTQVAPALTDCASMGGGGSSSQRQRDLQTTDGQTGVQNVVFGPRSAREFVTCSGQSSSSSICLNTAGRVTAYGSVPDTFYDELVSTVQATQYEDVDGLQKVNSVSAKAGGDPVPEGSGAEATDDRSDGGGNSVIETPKGNVSPNDGAISAGAAVGIALAALVVLLLAVFAYRSGRRQRGYDRRDAALKLAAHTEDEDDLVLGSGGEGGGGSNPDDETDADRIPGRRKAHVLGEDDSLMAASQSPYRDRNVEIRPVLVPFDEANDRNSSVKFVVVPPYDGPDDRHSSIKFVGPSPGIPPDASRTYSAEDTVLL